MSDSARDATRGTASAGALLRAARESQGLHIAALAAAIKVAPRKLDALENDRWSELPDATFARALAQTVCRTLKIESKPVLDLMPRSETAALESVSGHLNAPFRDRPGRGGVNGGNGSVAAAIRPMVWAGAALMVAALLVYFAPDNLWSSVFAPSAPAGPATASAPAAAASALGNVVPAALTGSAVTATNAALGAASTSLLDAGASVAAADAALTALTTANAANSVAAAASAATSTSTSTSTSAPNKAASGETVFLSPALGTAADTGAAAAAAAGVVQLRSSAPSWVDVRDAKNQVLLSRIVQPGEAVGLDGALPIRVTIGNAVVTQLSFRGQPVDVAANTRENIARIELK